MTAIEDLENEVILVKDAIDNDNQETTESPTNNLIFYYSVLINEASILLNYLVESDKLLASFKSVVQDSDFDLLSPSQFVDFSIKDSVGKNLIEF